MVRKKRFAPFVYAMFNVVALEKLVIWAANKISIIILISILFIWNEPNGKCCLESGAHSPYSFFVAVVLVNVNVCM